MTNGLNRKVDEGFRFTVMGKRFGFTSLPQMLTLLALTIILVKPYADVYFDIKQEKVEEVTTNQVRAVTTHVARNYVSNKVFTNTITDLYEIRTDDYANAQSTISDLMTKQETRIKSHFSIKLKNLEDKLLTALTERNTLTYVDSVSNARDDDVAYNN